MADAEFLARAQARAARETAAKNRGPVAVDVPAPRLAAPQKERTRLLHDDLAEVVNAHAASPETVLMALELLRHQVLAPRLRQMALE